MSFYLSPATAPPSSGQPVWDCAASYIVARYTPDPMQLTATVARAAG
ncbi:hypothetical protein ACGFI9_05325 [Micromonospora sp. NPDC048930]